MEIKIQGHEMKVSQELQEFVESKVDKLDRYLPYIDAIQVDLSHVPTKRGADLIIAQITLRHSRGAILRTEERLAIDDRNTVRTALVGAVDKMYKRIRRFKGKKENKRMRERFTATMEELELAEDTPDIEEEVPPADEPITFTEVIRRKKIGVIPMNETEAAEQMELLGHDFFVFFNGETNSINVLYRRKDGGYGVLIPQVE